jgi:hypothetical protein
MSRREKGRHDIGSSFALALLVPEDGLGLVQVVDALDFLRRELDVDRVRELLNAFELRRADDGCLTPLSLSAYVQLARTVMPGFESTYAIAIWAMRHPFSLAIFSRALLMA